VPEHNSQQTEQLFYLEGKLSFLLVFCIDTIQPHVMNDFWRVVYWPEYFTSIFVTRIGEVQTSERFLIADHFVFA